MKSLLSASPGHINRAPRLDLRPQPQPAAPTRNKNFRLPGLAQLAAVCAGLTFTIASAATNWTYATAKAQDPVQATIWGAVAVAAAVILALAPSAFTAALARRTWGSAAVSLTAVLLFGAFSVAAALGSATGGRAVASLNAADATRTRADAMAAIEFKSRELVVLPATRTLGELQAELDRLLASRRDLNGCQGEWLDHPNARKVCAEVAAVRAEIGRADRRARVESELAAARNTLGGLSSRATLANTDAEALRGFAAAAGVETTADSLNKLLVLLAVLLIELGGGLSFAVAGALGPAGTPPTALTREAVEVHRGAVQAETLASAAPVEGTPDPACTDDGGPCASARARLLSMLLDGGGAMRTTQRELAQRLGTSPARASQLLGELRSDGRISVRSSKTGTVVELR